MVSALLCTVTKGYIRPNLKKISFRGNVENLEESRRAADNSYENNMRFQNDFEPIVQTPKMLSI